VCFAILIFLRLVKEHCHCVKEMYWKAMDRDAIYCWGCSNAVAALRSLLFYYPDDVMGYPKLPFSTPDAVCLE
jgi:hypothetical protein